MLKHERHKRILEQLNTDKKINFVDLAQLLNVSYDSIRRDVIELEDKGFLKKVHGGAVANSYLSRLAGNGNSTSKNQDFQTIFKKITPILETSRTILLDGGTTNFYIAEHFPKHLSTTVITNNVPLAMVLNDHPKVNVILLGGTYFKRYQITMGFDLIRQLQNFKVDTYFMGTNGISVENGLTIRHHEESLLKQQMMAIASEVVCCSIDEKIGNVEAYRICEMSQISTLATNLKPSHELLLPFQGKVQQIL